MKLATQAVRDLIHPDCVSRQDYDALRNSVSDIASQLEGARSEIAGLRHELGNEISNAEALTALAARAIVSCEILREALIERQIGRDRQSKDPGAVLVVNLPDKKEEAKPRYIPMHKRRRQIERKRRDEELRRTALPKLLAELPPMPLTEADVEAMQEAVNELKLQLSAKQTEA